MSELEINRLDRIHQEIVYPVALLPENLDVLIGRMDYLDNRMVARAAIYETKEGEFSDGIIAAVKRAITDINKRDLAIIGTAACREDRLLRQRDSDGKAKARR